MKTLVTSPRRPASLGLLLAGALLASSCNKHSVPIITYQPIANFRQYTPGGAVSTVPVSQGIYTLYRVTGIQNPGSKQKPAAPFKFELSKLFVNNKPKDDASNSSYLTIKDGQGNSLLTPLSYTETIAANANKDYTKSQGGHGLLFIICDRGETDLHASDYLLYDGQGDNVALASSVPASYKPVYLETATDQQLADALNKAP